MNWKLRLYVAGNTWYDANGSIVTDPNDLAQAIGETSLTPYLKNNAGSIR